MNLLIFHRDDVIGLEQVKSQIEEAILDPLDNPELYQGPFYSDLVCVSSFSVVIKFQFVLINTLHCDL